MPVGGNFRIQLIFHRYGEANVESGYVSHVHLVRGGGYLFIQEFLETAVGQYRYQLNIGKIHGNCAYKI